MDLEKYYPWNWFAHEERQGSDNKVMPAERGSVALSQRNQELPLASVAQFHRDIDRLFTDTFSRLGFPSFFDRSSTPTGESFPSTHLGLKPQLDISTDKNRYRINVDLPGVDEKNVNLELRDNALVISGERKEEKENKDKHYYRIERSYGSFQRLLALPEDANREEIDASMKNGVLTVIIPRRELEAAAESKKININSL